MLLSKNRSATYEYEIIEKYTAGIELHGYEVKAIKEGKADFEGSFIHIEDDEAFVKNLYIGRYSKQGKTTETSNYKRNRRLLLTKNEIESIQKQIAQKGKTAVPLALVLQHNLIKLELAVVQGRKQHQKRQYIKERQLLRDLQKEVRAYKLK